MAEDSQIAQDCRLVSQARTTSKSLRVKFYLCLLPLPLLHVARIAYSPLKVGPWSGLYLYLEGFLL